VEISPPELGGPFLRALDVRAKFAVNIIAIRSKDGKMIVAPGPDYVVQAEDIVITLGRNEDINRLHIPK
jgi:trk system potassium uptake protein TrkA